MKLVSRLKIQGETWKVYETELAEDLDGECLFSKRHILISENLNQETFKESYLHEFMHSVCHELGTHLTTIHPDVIELLVDAAAKAIVKNQKEIKKILELC